MARTWPRRLQRQPKRRLLQARRASEGRLQGLVPLAQSRPLLVVLLLLRQLRAAVAAAALPPGLRWSANLFSCWTARLKTRSSSMMRMATASPRWQSFWGLRIKTAPRRSNIRPLQMAASLLFLRRFRQVAPKVLVGRMRLSMAIISPIPTLVKWSRATWSQPTGSRFHLPEMILVLAIRSSRQFRP